MNRLSKIAAFNVATAVAPGAFSRRKAIAKTCPEKPLYLFLIESRTPRNTR
jgi:hypothetical protein